MKVPYKKLKDIAEKDKDEAIQELFYYLRTVDALRGDAEKDLIKIQAKVEALGSIMSEAKRSYDNIVTWDTSPKKHIHFDTFYADLDTRVVYHDGQTIRFSKQEFEILTILMKNAQEIVKFESVDATTLANILRRVRSKGKFLQIETIRNVGFRLNHELKTDNRHVISVR